MADGQVMHRFDAKEFNAARKDGELVVVVLRETSDNEKESGGRIHGGIAYDKRGQLFSADAKLGLVRGDFRRAYPNWRFAATNQEEERQQPTVLDDNGIRVAVQGRRLARSYIRHAQWMYLPLESMGVVDTVIDEMEVFAVDGW